MSHPIKNFQELQLAIATKQTEIIIARSFLCATPILLPENTVLHGQAQENGALPVLSFADGDGVGVSKNNHIKNLAISAPANRRAVFNYMIADDLGDLTFENLTLTGQFSLIARKGVNKATIRVNGLDIVAADAAHYYEQPMKYGVKVLQGAFTVYNMNGDENSELSLQVNHLTIGRPFAPVIGSGVFVSGFGDTGGRVHISQLHTGAVYSNGKIPFGVANLITAGVFIVYGAKAQSVRHSDEIVTYGVNDMVLDAWGEVDEWISEKNVISYGPSGVGFVNFGYVKRFVVQGEVQTYGMGARGYNQYDGTVDEIEFKAIKTFGDGSVGIQISKKIGQLTVHENVETFGGVGNSLVKGVNVELPAIALSIKEGGEVAQLTIGGDVRTHGVEVPAYQVDAGKVTSFNLGGKIEALGNKAQAVVIENGGQTPNVETA